MAEQTGRQELEETLYNINIYLSNLTAQNEQRYKKDDEKEKRRELWEEKFGEKNISKNNQYLSRTIKSELNGLGKDIGNEIANSLPPALKELTSSITNSISKSFSTYNKIMDAADKDRQKQLEKLKKDYINGNANMPQSILDIIGGGSSGSSGSTTGSGGGGGGTPTSKVKMGDVDPEDAAGASKLGKLLPGIPGLGGLIGGAAKFAGPIALAGAALQIGGAVNKFQKQMAESGAITGEGRGAGLGAKFAAVKQGINPFDLVSSEFADKAITAFRSEGFKGSLAYSLSDSFLGITKQIGETLSKDLLPTVTDFASAMRGQGKATDQVKDSVASFAGVIKDLDSAAKYANMDTDALNKNFAALSQSLVKTGIASVDSANILGNFVKELTTKSELGGAGIGGEGGTQLAASQALIGASPFLAGMSGIASPLALVGDTNVAAVTTNFNKLFVNLANAAPDAVFTSLEGVQQYAAYLNAAFLPGIGISGFTVGQVAQLLIEIGRRKISPSGARRTDFNGSVEAQSKSRPLEKDVMKGWKTFNKSENVEKITEAIGVTGAATQNGATMDLDFVAKSIDKAIESDSDLKATGITGEEVKDFLKKSGSKYTNASLKGFLQARAAKNELLSSKFLWKGKVPNQTIEALDLTEKYAEKVLSAGKKDTLQDYLQSGKAELGITPSKNEGGATQAGYVTVYNIIQGKDLGNLISGIKQEIKYANEH